MRGKLLFAFVSILCVAAGAANGIERNLKMKITFSGYTRPETLTNFPVLIVLSNNINNSTFDYGQFASTNGWDLQFQNSNETSLLNYEVERWDTGGSSYVWVQVTDFNSNSCVWAYWGNPIAPSAPPVYTTNGATWNSGYRGVWHLNQTAADSTSRGNNGTSAGNTNSTGKIAGAQGFDGSTAYIGLGNNGSLNITNSLTISAWLYSNTGVGWSYAYSAGNGAGWSYDYGITGNSRWGLEIRPPAPRTLEDGVAEASQWHHIVFVFDDDNNAEYLYQDGVQVTMSGDPGPIKASDKFRIGGKFEGGGPFWNGMIDELRISSVARSPGWIWASYMNQPSNTSFNTCGRVSLTNPGTVIIIR